ncbi:class I SAM-dependent methyltransferase [Halorussus gelatinilyticus]|uniref:Class I SAM-dependent methyltransferase n=1 Tax=Halorussus gelatinilyticus TaxID=2937524 RepID=A0A8U0IG74_9EURY|nr:HemK2/MTQ2 family protein methyltransferase [Halorussus gelatinilyticus]UPW00087.1 class I SAM-dependent methyltransferase [Halorussus gelatinilyticus]
MTDLADRRDAETEVYQPAEDSHLLADAAVTDLRNTSTETPPTDDASLALEVGTGSGYVAETVADETGLRVLGSDLNPHACRQARERGVEAVRADLLDPFRDDAFDAVLFNPPYLPTDPDDERDDWMEVALSGGEDGRKVIEPFLEAVGRALAPDGAVYLLVSSLTGVEEVVALAEREGFSAVALRDESFPFETLTVLKLLR